MNKSISKCHLCKTTLRSRYDFIYHMLMVHGTKVALILLSFVLIGCQDMHRLIEGKEPEPTSDEPTLYVVACCRESEAPPTFPSFVPVAHQNLCLTVEEANRKNQLINGDVYLAAYNDCGKFGKIGEEYYAGRNY